MSERCTLQEMADHLSAAAVEATEPVEGAWLELCQRYDMAEWRGARAWEPEEAAL
jgi:hypothetical protein